MNYLHYAKLTITHNFDEYFHFVYGIAKDLYLTGLRMGYYYTENEI